MSDGVERGRECEAAGRVVEKGWHAKLAGGCLQ